MKWCGLFHASLPPHAGRAPCGYPFPNFPRREEENIDQSGRTWLSRVPRGLFWYFWRRVMTLLMLRSDPPATQLRFRQQPGRCVNVARQDAIRLHKPCFFSIELREVRMGLHCANCALCMLPRELEAKKGPKPSVVPQLEREREVAKRLMIWI